jgi:hypothetical protein
MGRKKSKPIPPPTAPPPPAEDVSAEIVSPVMRRAASRRIQSTYTTRGQKMGRARLSTRNSSTEVCSTLQLPS